MSTTTTPIPIATHIKEEPAFSPPYHVENASDSDGEEESNSVTCYGVKVVAKTPVSSPVGEVTVQKKQKITKEEKAQKAAERKAKKEAAEEEKARKAAEREIKKKAIEEKKAAAEAEKALKAAARKAKKEAAEAEKAEKAAKRAAKKKVTDEKTTKKTTDLLANLGIGETVAEELQAENFVQPKVTHENAAEENVHAQQIEEVMVEEREEDVEPVEEVVVEAIEAMVDGRMQKVEVVEQQIKEVEKAVDSKEGDIVDEDANSPSNDSLDLDAEDVSNKMNELRGFIKKQNELLEEQKKTAHEINRIYGDLANMFGESPTG